MKNSPAKRFVRQASDPSIECHNPPPTPEMAEFAVKQEFKKEVDINTIIANMNRGIQPPPWMTANTPRYGDFTDLPASFSEAYDIIERAETAFMSLPLEMRKELDHDPRNLDHATREMYEKYGLLKKPESTVGSTLPPGDPVARGRGESVPAKEPKAPKKQAEPPAEGE